MLRIKFKEPEEIPRTNDRVGDPSATYLYLRTPTINRARADTPRVETTAIPIIGTLASSFITSSEAPPPSP